MHSDLIRWSRILIEQADTQMGIKAVSWTLKEKREGATFKGRDVQLTILPWVMAIPTLTAEEVTEVLLPWPKEWQSKGQFPDTEPFGVADISDCFF